MKEENKRIAYENSVLRLRIQEYESILNPIHTPKFKTDIIDKDSTYWNNKTIHDINDSDISQDNINNIKQNTSKKIKSSHIIQSTNRSKKIYNLALINMVSSLNL